MKYTKGKWKIKKGLTQFYCYAVQKDGSEIRICSINHTAPEHAENGRLIKSAPMMFDVLHEIAKYRNTEAGQLAIKAIKELIK